MTAPFPFEAWARPGKDAFDFWISFFPTAPLFGVEWRFADMMQPGMNPFLQAGGVPFPMPFPGTRAAGAAARPGEVLSPAMADEAATRPVAKAADAAAETTRDGARIAAETGAAVARSTEAVAKTGGDAAAGMARAATGIGAETGAAAARSTDTAVRTGGGAAAEMARAAQEHAATTTAPIAHDISPAQAEKLARKATEAATAPAGAGEADDEVEEKAEARASTTKPAETAVDDVAGVGEAGSATVDAAIAAAPKPTVLLDARPDNPDDLKMIKGVGPGLEKQLNELGLYRFEQLARMTEADLVWIDAHLTSFKGRCFRDDWIGQAKARLGR